MRPPFKPYREYRESGITWLGLVPIHWTVAPVYARYEVALGKMLDSKRTTGEHLAPYLRNVDVQWDRVRVGGLPEMDFAPEERGRYSLRHGDLLVCEGGEVGRTAIWRGELPECFYQKAIHRLRPFQAGEVPRFLYYLMYAAANLGVFSAGSNPNTIDHLTGVKLRRHRIPFPSHSEQQAIVSFLDRETAKIEALVAKKERLIELLRERRADLIDRAVTGHLSAVPRPWHIRRLKFLASMVTSGSRGWAQHYADEGAVFLRISNLSRMSIDLDLADIQRVAPPRGAEGERTRVHRNDVLVSITAYIGSVGVVTKDLGEAYVNQHIALVRPQPGTIMPRWLGYCLLSRTGQEQFGLLLYGGTKDGLGLDDVRNLAVPVPPIDEQRELVARLDERGAETERLIAKLRGHIDRLQEYRSALITAAVTGKIDVREEAGTRPHPA